MTSKKYWNQVSKKFLNLHRAPQAASSIKIEGSSFDVFPEVFSPLLSSDTKWFIQQLIPLVRGKSFLEIGTGSGVIGCLAKLNGAQHVVMTDINPKAVENARHNARKYSLDIPVFLGDMFDPLPLSSRFDIIFWNHPFNYTEDKEDQNGDLSRSVFDFSYSSLKKYFRRSRDFLAEKGILLLGTGNVARINLIKRISQENCYKMNLIRKETVQVSQQLDKVKMDVRLYSFLG